MQCAAQTSPEPPQLPWMLHWSLFRPIISSTGSELSNESNSGTTVSKFPPTRYVDIMMQSMSDWTFQNPCALHHVSLSVHTTTALKQHFKASSSPEKAEGGAINESNRENIMLQRCSRGLQWGRPSSSSGTHDDDRAAPKAARSRGRGPILSVSFWPYSCI